MSFQFFEIIVCIAFRLILELQGLLEEINSLLSNFLASKRQDNKKWLRSEEVKAMLGILTGKLFQLRKKGILPYSQIDRVFFYDAEDIDKMLRSRK